MNISHNKKIIIGIVLIIVVISGAYELWVWYEGHKARNSELTLYGNVDIRQVDLGFRVGGRIAELLVDEGNTVTAGQPLAKLDNDLFIQQRDQAAAGVAGQQAELARLEKGYRTQEIAQARASVAAAKAVAENANINLHRVITMHAENAISQKELDNARATEREAAARLKSAQDNLDMLDSGYREEDILAQKAALRGAEAELKGAEIRLGDGVLYAPQKGVILTRAREAGSIVQEGQTVYTLTLTEPVWLRAYVSEPDLGKIKPGMPVRVSVDAVSGKTFTGSVGFIAPTAEFTPKTVETKEVRTNLVYRVRILADDPENVMRQGMPVTIFIDIPQ